MLCLQHYLILSTCNAANKPLLHTSKYILTFTNTDYYHNHMVLLLNLNELLQTDKQKYSHSVHSWLTMHKHSLQFSNIIVIIIYILYLHLLNRPRCVWLLGQSAYKSPWACGVICLTVGCPPWCQSICHRLHANALNLWLKYQYTTKFQKAKCLKITKITYKNNWLTFLISSLC